MSVELLFQVIAPVLSFLAWTGLQVLLAGATISILNALTAPRLAAAPAYPDPPSWPAVSILVPARDEAGVIATSVHRLLAQQYPGELELLILDDDSTDGTGTIARQAGGDDPRLCVMDGLPLPSGWVGKNWACAQLAGQARGDLLVFTDADVRWEPQALQAIVRLVHRYSADCLTVMPTQRTHTWSERLVVPMIAFSTLSFLPELGVRYIRWPAFATANGQCLAFRREAYDRIGGHSGVKSSVIEDMSLARRVKKAGLKLVIAQAGPLISTRMYTCWHGVRHGFAKNILALHGGRTSLLALSMAVHGGLFILPFIWLAVGWLPSVLQTAAGKPALSSLWPALPAAMVALALGMRMLTAAVSGARLADAIFLPVTMALVIVIAAQAVWWHYRRGGPKWKGRRITIK